MRRCDFDRSRGGRRLGTGSEPELPEPQYRWRTPFPHRGAGRRQRQPGRSRSPSTIRSGYGWFSSVSCYIPPIFILSDKIIQTSPARPLTVEQIKQVLENHILKNNFVKNIEFDASEYLNNTDVEGEYIVSYSYLNQNDEKVEDTFEIIVKGDSQTKNTRVSIWTKIRIFFEKLWNWICGRGFKANSEL